MSANISRNNTVEVHAIVKGQVQGVGFRYTARQEAMKLGLLGTVSNLPDGSVEIYMKGPKFIVHNFLEELRTKHFEGKITAISMNEVSPQNQYLDFSILK